MEHEVITTLWAVTSLIACVGVVICFFAWIVLISKLAYEALRHKSGKEAGWYLVGLL